MRPAGWKEVVELCQTRACCACVTLLLASVPLHAQDNDPRAISEQPPPAQDNLSTTSDQSAGAAPQGTVWTERLTMRVKAIEEQADQVVDSLHRRGFFPSVKSIIPGSGLAFGGRLRDDHLFSWPIGAEVEALWSVRGHQLYAVRLGIIDQARDMLQLDGPDTNVTNLFNDHEATNPGTALFVVATYQHAPQLNYFGVGGVGGARADFGLRSTSLELVGQWQPATWLGLTSRIGVAQFDVEEGVRTDQGDVAAMYTTSSAPGLHERPRYLTVGGAAVVDFRDHHLFPTEGLFGGGAVWRMMPNADAHYGFTRAAVDIRAFVPLGSPKHVAAFHFLGAIDDSPPSEPTPFYLQYWLGGSQSLRAYPSYHVRGEALAHLTVEYRWRVIDAIHLVAFADVGDVGPDFQTLQLTTAHATPGLGVWIGDRNRLFSRIDWAYGRAGHRIFWSLSPSF